MTDSSCKIDFEPSFLIGSFIHCFWVMAIQKNDNEFKTEGRIEARRQLNHTEGLDCLTINATSNLHSDLTFGECEKCKIVRGA